MAKARIQFICQNCGTVHTRWAGKCDSCGEWNTLVEEGTNSGIGSGPGAMLSKRKGRAVALTSLSGDIEDAPRIISGISELDRVTGGGFVRGSALLIGGDPGIGKSTLLTQAAAALANRGQRIVYVSGEEAVAQIRLRAQRLGVASSAVELAAETNVEDIIATISDTKRPDLVIIDSIQTLWTDMADSAPGTVTQVRSSAQAMIRYAKQTGAAVVLVGHVTKDGQIAGPRVVEHMVDGVLYFEGEGGHHYRILRTVKNRFGPTDEIGVFEMSDGGLREVSNPSELFLVSAMPKLRVRRSSPAWKVRARFWWKFRRSSPLLARHTAPRRCGLGRRSSRHDSRRAGIALWCPFRPARCLSECRGRLSDQRTGSRYCRCLGTRFLHGRYCPSARLCLFRRNQPFRCCSCGNACSTEAQGSREARFPAGRGARWQRRTVERSQLPPDGNFGFARPCGTHRGFRNRKEAINLETCDWKVLSTFR